MTEASVVVCPPALPCIRCGQLCVEQDGHDCKDRAYKPERAARYRTGYHFTNDGLGHTIKCVPARALVRKR